MSSVSLQKQDSDASSTRCEYVRDLTSHSRNEHLKKTLSWAKVSSVSEQHVQLIRQHGVRQRERSCACPWRKIRNWALVRLLRDVAGFLSQMSVMSLQEKAPVHISGFVIVGEDNTGKLDLGIFIASVVPDGPADKDGRIKPGTGHQNIWLMFM